MRQCEDRATMLARYTDNQGRPFKQRELYNRRADWLRENRTNVCDLRNPGTEKPVKRRLQERDAALASDNGPIFLTVAKLVESLDRAFPASDDLEL